MENNNPMELRKNLESKLIEKAWKDEEFKASLTSNPEETIKKELNIKIPDGINIKVLEETEEEVYLVLPQDPVKTGQMLSVTELDSVAGGSFGCSTEDTICQYI